MQGVLFGLHTILECSSDFCPPALKQETILQKGDKAGWRAQKVIFSGIT